MATKQTVWAAKKRLQLLAALGGRCVECGSADSLTFDCIKPQGGAHHSLNPAGRMTFYANQARMGNLQVLCHACNSRKAAGANPVYRPSVTDGRSTANGIKEFLASYERAKKFGVL
jgi:hypothetical protein